jgi:hypothetical protein
VLSKTLRNEVAHKLGIEPRTLRSRISARSVEAGLADRDVTLLLIAHENEIDVRKPRFAVSKEMLERLNEYLRAPRISRGGLAHGPSLVAREEKNPPPQRKRLLKFKGKYPDIFYDRLEDEINAAYNDPRMPNAALLLSRKLIENLVYNLLQIRFKGRGIDIYFDTDHNRALDFSVLLDNLKTRQVEFDADIRDTLTRFLKLVDPFRLDANSKAHNVMEYLEKTSQLNRMKIPEMVQMLLNMIARLK